MILRPLPLFLLAVTAAFAVHTPNSRLAFEPNQGQVEPEVEYLVRTPGGLLYLTSAGLVLHRAGSAESIWLDFPGEPSARRWTPGGRMKETISYLTGRDRSRWAEGVPHFSRLERRGILPGVDLHLYASDDGNLEYDFIAGPGADLTAIELRVRGAKNLSIDHAGRLVIDTPSGGAIRQRKPVLYQSGAGGLRHNVSGGFELRGNDRAGFRIGNHDPALPITIDPVLESGTYLGGTADEKVVAVWNSTGAAGNTSSIDFPGAPGRRRGRDLFFQDGDFTRIIGGSGDDEALSGTVFTLCGATDSTDLPTQLSTFSPNGVYVSQPEFAGGATDGFYVANAKLPDTTLISYVGGPGTDRLTAAGGSGFFAGVTDTGLNSVVPAHTPKGGLDFFVIFPTGGGLWGASQLFGGSGDDIPYSATVLGTDWAVAGGTKSPDFVAGDGTWGGEDGFVVTLASTAARFSPDALTVRLQKRFGGAGDDIVTGIGRSGARIGYVVGIAGDGGFPSPSAGEEKCGGAGASDIFVFRLSASLAAEEAWCFGGEGAEYPAALLGGPGGDLVVAGWTESTGFPVVRPLYDSLKGTRDGFVTRIRPGVRGLYSSTYYGGSGRDEITSIGEPAPGSVQVGGMTTSLDLPLAASFGGGTDAFFVNLVFQDLTFPRIVGGVGMRVRSYVSPGSSSTPPVPVTVTSNDPAKVLIAPSAIEASGREVTIYAGGTYARDFWVDCAAEGPASLTVSAPNYPSATIPIECTRPALNVRVLPSSSAITLAGVPYPAFYYLGPYSVVEVSAVSIDPSGINGQAPLSYPPGAAPQTVVLTPLDPEAAEIVPSRVVLGQNGAGTFQFLWAPGADTVDLRIEMGSARVQPGPVVRFSQSPQSVPFTISPLVLTAGTQRLAFLDNSGGRATVTSSDPSRVLLSPSPGIAGSPSITLSSERGSGAYLQAMKPGSGTIITFASPGRPPEWLEVQVIEGGFSLSMYSPAIVDESAVLTAGVYPVQGSGSYLNPDHAPVRLRISSSDSSIIPPAEVEVLPGQAFPLISLTAAAPGRATLTLSADGVDVNPERSSTEIIVREPAVRMDPIDMAVGSRASARVRFSSLAAGQKPVTVTSEDPALVRVNGGASAMVRALSGQFADVSIQAGDRTGETRLLLSGPGIAPSTARVRVGPVAWIWGSKSLRVDSQTRVPLRLSVLDFETLLPLRLLDLFSFAGPPPPPRIVSSDTAVVTGQVNDLREVNLTPIGTGRTVLTIVQPPGTPQPASGVTLDAIVPEEDPFLVIDRNTVHRDMEARASVRMPRRYQQAPVTITSGDPARLLISARSGEPGRPSITLQPGERDFVIQGTGAPGTAKVILAAEETLGEWSVLVTPTLVQISGGTDAPPDNAGRLRTVAGSPVPISLVLAASPTSGGDFQARRAGAPPVQVRLRSTRPEVGTIEPSTITLDGLDYGSATFRALATGETEIAMEVPEGYAARGPNRIVKVDPLALTGPDVLIGRAAMSLLTVRLPSAAQLSPINRNVTISSGDPSKVLLSVGNQTAPAASIQAVLLAGSSSVEFWAHGLAASGTVRVTMSGPGLTESSFRVHLTGLRFEPDNRFNEVTSGSGQRQIYVNARLEPGPASLTTPLPVLRPSETISARLTSSSPGVVRVDRGEIDLARSPQDPFLVTPVAAGSAILTLEVPGHSSSTPAAEWTMTVRQPRLTLSRATIGKDMREFLTLDADTPFTAPAIVRIRANEPDRLLLANSPGEPGDSEVGFSTSLVSRPGVHAFAVGEPGTATVIATANGYEPAAATIEIVPSGVRFSSSSPVTMVAGSNPMLLTLVASTLDPVTLAPRNTAAPRGGYAPLIKVESSDPAVVSVTPGEIALPPSGFAEIRLVPRAPGTAIVTVPPLPGQPGASSGRQIVVTVTRAANAR